MKIKIDRPRLMQFLDALKGLMYGIQETIRIGDDGYQASCIEQVDDIVRFIKEFTATDLVPVTPLKKKEPAYLTLAATKRREEDHTYAENVAVYQARLYAYIYRNLGKIPELDGIKNDWLEMKIEEAVIIGSPFQREYYSNEWFYTSMAVVTDVATEIREARAAHPQRSLF